MGYSFSDGNVADGLVGTRASPGRIMQRFTGQASDLLIRVRLFLSSYAPLFLILGVRFTDVWLTWSFLVLATLSIVTGLLIFRSARQIATGEYVFTSVEDRGAEVSGYLATYLLPFVTVVSPSLRDIIGYAIFFGIAGVLYVRSEMIQINPTLYIFGWKVVAVTVDKTWTAHLLTRGDITPGTTVSAVRFRDKIFIAF